jgi:hypothetical protein
MALARLGKLDSQKAQLFPKYSRFLNNALDVLLSNKRL